MLKQTLSPELVCPGGPAIKQNPFEEELNIEDKNKKLRIEMATL